MPGSDEKDLSAVLISLAILSITGVPPCRAAETVLYNFASDS